MHHKRQIPFEGIILITDSVHLPKLIDPELFEPTAKCYAKLQSATVIWFVCSVNFFVLVAVVVGSENFDRRH